MAEVEEAVKGEDREVITQKTSDLYAAAQPIQKAKEPPADATTDTPPADDGVVDVDATEVKKD
jgi:hypothetical protein